MKNNVDNRKTFLNILQHVKYKESDVLKYFKFNEESVDRYITLDNKAAADELISNFDNTASRFGYLIL